MTSTRSVLVPSLALATVLLLGACGGDDDTDGDASADTSEASTSTTGAAAEPGDTVTIERSRFEPDTLEVTVGAEVAFENLDPYAHTVTSADDSPVAFDSGELPQDETFTQTFDEAGTYAYFCEIHPTMRAEVVVS